MEPLEIGLRHLEGGLLLSVSELSIKPCAGSLRGSKSLKDGARLRAGTATRALSGVVSVTLDEARAPLAKCTFRRVLLKSECLSLVDASFSHNSHLGSEIDVNQ